MKKLQTLEIAMPQLIHLSQAEVDEAKKKITRLYNQKRLRELCCIRSGANTAQSGALIFHVAIRWSE